jgi:putative spermidine/putrescine transport system substrate-binding protein
VGGSIDNLRLFDWSQINAQRAGVTNDWNRKVTAKN